MKNMLEKNSFMQQLRKNKQSKAEMLLSSGLHWDEVCKSIGISSRTLSKWFPKVKPRKTYQRKMSEKRIHPRKEFVLSAIKEGRLSVPEIAKDFAITQGTVYRWLKEYLEEVRSKK